VCQLSGAVGLQLQLLRCVSANVRDLFETQYTC
jgi:hypothetical protein